MTEKQKNYSCTHGYSKAGKCPTCINMYNDMEDRRVKKLAHIANVKAEMKDRGFTNVMDYLEYLALKDHK